MLDFSCSVDSLRHCRSVGRCAWRPAARSARRERALRLVLCRSPGAYELARASVVRRRGPPVVFRAWRITGREGAGRNRSARVPADAARRRAPRAAGPRATDRRLRPRCGGLAGSGRRRAARSAKRVKMVPEPPSWRRRGFVPGGRVTALPNRCFTGVRITQAAASGVRPGGGAIFSALSNRPGQPAAAAPRR